MKAAIYHGVGDIRIEEIDYPKPGDMGAVLKIRAAGICGTDLHAYKVPWLRYTTGIALGHEFCGDVVEIGTEVKDVRVGDRVWAMALGPCNQCEACQRKDYFRCTGMKSGGVSGLHGGFAEYVWLPIIALNRNVIKITDDMNHQDGALIEPIGVGVVAVQRAEPESSNTVVVLGTGVVGLGSIAKFKDLDVAKIIASDVSEKRLAVAKELGADVIVNATKENIVEIVMAETSGTGADIVVEAAGKPVTFLQSIDMVRRNGKIMVVATYDESIEFNPSLARPGLPMTSLVRNSIRMIGCYGSDMRGAFDLISKGKVRASQIVTHAFPLDRILEGFETQMGVDESIKVMIEP